MSAAQDLTWIKKKHGKRYAESVKALQARLEEAGDAPVSYTKAVDVLLELQAPKFDQSAEVSFRLGVDPKKADQMIRGAIVLPHGLGKSAKVAVFAKGDKAKEAEQAGADIVGAEDLAEKISGGFQEFSSVVATPDMMGTVSKLGKILGPRGLMPNPKLGTVTFELKKVVEDLKKGRAEYRVDRHGVVHAAFGRLSFGADKLKENLKALADQILRAKPATIKGNYVQSVYISATMSPSVPVSPLSFTEAKG